VHNPLVFLAVLVVLLGGCGSLASSQVDSGNSFRSVGEDFSSQGRASILDDSNVCATLRELRSELVSTPASREQLQMIQVKLARQNDAWQADDDSDARLAIQAVLDDLTVIDSYLRDAPDNPDEVDELDGTLDSLSRSMRSALLACSAGGF